MMDAILNDLRYAFRSLRRAPGVAAVAVLTLALGIGANTAVFTLGNAALFRPVPAAAPDRLVQLHTSAGRGAGRNLSYPEYREFRDRLTGVVDLFASEYVPMSIGDDTPERVRGLIVSGNYFDVLGIRPAVGRTFTPEEDGVPGAHSVAVLGYRLWERRYGSDANVVGRTVTINGRPFTVIGVAPRGFEHIEFGSAVQVWVPLAAIAAAWPAERDRLTKNETWLHVRGRLQPGVTLGRADGQADQIARSLAVTASARGGLTGATVSALPPGGMRPKGRAQLATAFTLLVGVAVLVLLVACANVANLLLARALTRRHEIAIRLSLGATRTRLVRQLLTEAVLLSVVAACVSIVVAFWAASTLGRLTALPASVLAGIVPDLRVLLFATALAAATGLIFGLVPALSATRVEVAPTLKHEPATVGRGRRMRLRDLLVVAQVSVSLVLAVSAGLFLRSLGNVLEIDPGFDARNRVALSFDLTMDGYTDAQRSAFYASLVERARELPGVLDAGVGGLPLSSEHGGGRFTPEIGQAPEDGAMYAGVRPRYFRTLGIPLVRGRDFNASDARGALPTIIVNESFAAWLWPKQDAIGQRVRLGGRGEPLREVVGIVRDAKYVRLTENGYAFAYLPEPQLTSAPPMSLIVRTADNPARLVSALRAIVREIAPRTPVVEARTLTELVEQSANTQRGAARLLAIFGALALGLAALGIYGVVAHAVVSRTREIGVRVALGAQRRSVLSLFVLSGVRLAALGVVPGLILAVAAAGVVRNQLYGVEPIDPLVAAAAAAVFAAAAALASYLPARRATKVDPMTALRTE